MSKELNFQKAKKTFLTVTMPDDEKILIRNPTKKIMDAMTDLSEEFKALEGVDPEEADTEQSRESITRIYEACALIMSNNIARKPITVAYLEDLLDVEDLITFFKTYTDFIAALQASVKN